MSALTTTTICSSVGETFAEVFLIIVAIVFLVGIGYFVGSMNPVCSHGPKCIYCNTSRNVLAAVELEAEYCWMNRKKMIRSSDKTTGWCMHPDGGLVWLPEK